MRAVVAPIYSAGSSDKHIVECRNGAHGTHCRDGDVGVAHAQRAVRGRQSAYFTMCCATLVFYAPMSWWATNCIMPSYTSNSYNVHIVYLNLLGLVLLASFSHDARAQHKHRTTQIPWPRRENNVVARRFICILFVCARSAAAIFITSAIECASARAFMVTTNHHHC